MISSYILYLYIYFWSIFFFRDSMASKHGLGWERAMDKQPGSKFKALNQSICEAKHMTTYEQNNLESNAF